ncbi:hypothetical protein [Mycobacterium sp.]|uniref:hypothetical protein n=1 Tax=Mycobacterium sp. TaxID=1785 RepID=UPI0025D1A22C|nr:hypothetical protein [Mycobacterium sp.]
MNPVGPQPDFGASEGWPPGFYEHLDAYRQGHVIDEVPTFFLASDTYLWSGRRQTLVAETPSIVGEEGYPLRRAMILTQSCDLMKGNNPWITVAPVYDAFDRLPIGQHGQVKGAQIGHYIHVTADWAADRLWVADLRLEIPVEKTLLMTRHPAEAFPDEAGYAQLALRLGARRQRLAAPQSCIDLVVTPLFASMRALPDGGVALNSGVREIRVDWNDPNTPTVVTVFVVATDEAARQKIDGEGWAALVLGLYGRAQSGGITIVGPEITSMTDMCAADYIQSSLIEDTQSS